VAVVGCGAISRELHLPILAGHEAVQLTALVDRDRQRAGELARGYGVERVLADAAELSPEFVDAAIVATPPSHHAPGSIQLMQKGLHVLVEKPMATSHDDAMAMVRTAQEHGVILAVGFFRRLAPSIRLLKALLDSQWLGRPLCFEADGGGMYSWGAATLANMRKDLAGGGALIDFGSHLLDLLHFLFRGPGVVLEYRDNARGGIEADCAVRLRLHHHDLPVEGRVEVTRTRNVGNLIRVHCEKGSLEYRINERFRIWVAPHDLKLNDSSRPGADGSFLQAGWVGEKDVPWMETVRTEIEDWLEAIRTGRPAQLSGQSALPTVRVIEDCYRQPLPLAEPWTDEGVSGKPLAAVNGKARRVLITGASGFIGCRVAEILALREGWQVRAMVHNPASAARLARLPVEMIQADLGSAAEMGPLVQGCDAVVHCAIGTEWGDRRQIFKVTVEGTRNLALAAQGAGARRFVHLSTIAVHGPQVTGVMDESTPARPPRGDDYGESKLEAERLVLDLARRGFPSVVLRPACVYGPFSRIFITRPIEALAQGRLRWVRSAVSPSNTVYVDNLVEAIVRSLEAPEDKVRGEVFTIGDGDGLSWQDFFGYFARELGLELPAPDQLVEEESAPRRPALWKRIVTWPAAWLRGWKTILKSGEFRALGKRYLRTDPMGRFPRWLLKRFPWLRRGVERMFGAGGPPLYRRAPAASAAPVLMGSSNFLVSIAKAKRVLGYEPVVSRERAMQMTLDWIRYARLV
jgi:predicted dehydrogenase/nucleoside-diphosphate-sugar epimerase